MIDLEQQWRNFRYVVIDVEGNGQQPPEIVEIAAMELLNGITMNAPHSWLVKPERPITSIVTRIHHISNKDVESCLQFRDIEPEVSDYLRNDIVIAHNASVDYKVIKRQLANWEPLAVIDTLKMTKKIRPKLASYSLEKLIAEFLLKPQGVTTELNLHRASYDVAIAANLFSYLISDGGIVTIKDLLDVGQLNIDQNSQL